MRYSDDGEPQGTAASPCWRCSAGKGSANAVCVVTRYFGGVLLGGRPLLRPIRERPSWPWRGGHLSGTPLDGLTIPAATASGKGTAEEIPVWDGVVLDTEYGADVVIKALLPEGKRGTLPSGSWI